MFCSLAKRSVEPGSSSAASQRYGISCEPNVLNQAASRALSDQPCGVETRRFSAGAAGLVAGLAAGSGAGRPQAASNISGSNAAPQFDRIVFIAFPFACADNFIPGGLVASCAVHAITRKAPPGAGAVQIIPQRRGKGGR